MVNGFIEHPGTGRNDRRNIADITRIRNGVIAVLREVGRDDLVTNLLRERDDHMPQQHMVAVVPRLVVPSKPNLCVLSSCRYAFYPTPTR